MRQLDKPHRKRIFDAFGQTRMDGHAGFCNLGQELWGPHVLEFLEDAMGAKPGA